VVARRAWLARPRRPPSPTLSPAASLLFQKDFEGSRLRGLLRAIGQAKELLAPLSPRDRVAVLTFDSHLRLHLDFTADLGAVSRVLDESVLLRWPAIALSAPSLAAHPTATKHGMPPPGAGPRPCCAPRIPGAKMVPLRLRPDLSGGTVVPPDYDAARRPDRPCRCLRLITEASWHSRGGLQQVAEDTGGQYRCDENAGAPSWVVAALAGRHVLTFDRPSAAGERALSRPAGTSSPPAV
jgi:hypothetical protein